MKRSNPSFASSLPNFSGEDFPPLNRNKAPQRNILEEISFKKFLTIKHNDDTKKMTNMNVFEIEKGLQAILGKKSNHNVSPLRSGLLLIEVVREQDYKKLKETKKIGDIPVSISDHATLNSSKGVIYCDHETVKNMSNESIQAELKDQNVSEVYRIMKRNPDYKKPQPKQNENTNENQDENNDQNNDQNKDTNQKVEPEFLPTHSFIITFNTTRVPNSIKLGYLKINVKLYIPNPRICFNCQRYGHNTNKCQHDQICAKCGDFGHDYNSCKEVPFCYHCHQDHPTSYKKCPMFLLEKLIIEDKVRSNVTFREARNKIYHLNPQLTSQIPHLNQSRPQNSYSNTSASSPVSSDVHKILLQQQKQIALLNDHIAKLLAVIPNSKQSRVSESSDSNMDTSLPNIPHYQRKRNVKKTTDGKRRRRDSLSSFDGDSSPE